MENNKERHYQYIVGCAFRERVQDCCGFASVSGTVDIDNKYVEYEIAVRNRFEEQRTDVSFENTCSGVDFDKNSST